MPSTQPHTTLLTDKLKTAIDKWAKKYPPERRQSAVLPAFLIVQDHNGGWLSREWIDAVADYLNMPRVTAYEVANFYSMYSLQPIGRYKIGICTNVSCMLNNADNVVNHLKTKLGIGFGETTPDGRFTLQEVECLGACIKAPVIYLNHQFYENLSSEKVDELLESLD